MTYFRRSSGFVSRPVAGVLVALAVILGLFLALKVQSARLDAAKADLEACTTRYAETLKSVEKANSAVKDLQKESEERAKKAAAALAKARAAQGSLEAEMARLRASKPADCAGAVAAVREGLAR